MVAPKIENVPDEFDWIQLSDEINPKYETIGQKFARKALENPFVPIGAFGALGALSYGLWCFKNDDRRMQQIMMRARVGAQGFCVIALIAGLFFNLGSKRK